MSDFEKCIFRRWSNDGLVYQIDCHLGLWGVEGSDKAFVECQAYHYWQQYASDGEYYRIIGGKSPVDILQSKLKEE